jgi:hypothetical protein
MALCPLTSLLKALLAPQKRKNKELYIGRDAYGPDSAKSGHLAPLTFLPSRLTPLAYTKSSAAKLNREDKYRTSF